MRKLFFIACMLLTALFVSSCGEKHKETFVCDITYTLDNYGDYVVVEETDTVQVTYYNHRWYGLYLKYIEYPDNSEKKLMICTDSYNDNFSTKQVCVTSLPIVCYSMHVHKLNCKIMK